MGGLELCKAIVEHTAHMQSAKDQRNVSAAALYRRLNLLNCTHVPRSQHSACADSIELSSGPPRRPKIEVKAVPGLRVCQSEVIGLKRRFTVSDRQTVVSKATCKRSPLCALP